MKSKILFVLALFTVLTLSACAEEAPKPESDSSQQYSATARVPVDDAVYTIEGTVAGDIQSLTRQTQVASGSFAGSSFGFYGSYFGAEFKGKGFVRLLVERSETDLAPIGRVTLLKVTDTKAILLLPGDKVTFKCRRQYEAIAAVTQFEEFDTKKVETWELDYCRLASPVVNR